jgi:fatty-acyl-CoA synthase
MTAAQFTESTMQDFPLTLQHIFQFGRTVHANSEVSTYDGSSLSTATFAEVAERTDRLAAALAELGVEPGDRVATLSWNNQRHLEAYFAVPCMGAVLHTLNIRLAAEHLIYIIEHAEPKVLLVDASLLPTLREVQPQLTCLDHIIVCGQGGNTEGMGETLDYEALIDAQSEPHVYPELDERAGAGLCYTSGTTGNPKGVLYSHRSTFLHSLAALGAPTLQMTESDRLLVIVPMFHALAWGMPYAGWWAGSDFVFPQSHLQAAPVAWLIEQTRPTISAAVPTVLNDILNNATDADLSSLRFMVCGGAPVPKSLIASYRDQFGVEVVQGWGMTETSPLCALSWEPAGAVDEDEVLEWRARTGRVLPGVEIRVCDDDGIEQPWDGAAVGEIEVRGPWITGRYFRTETPERFHDGWLRTGDVGTIEPNGFVQITDRAKDVIKSGGEWISSVELENALMSHPDVLEAAVVGVPDDRWDERPLACVVLHGGRQIEPATLNAWLEDRVVKWWLPERWTFIDEVPKTSVGKFDKKVLRARYAAAELDVLTAN